MDVSTQGLQCTLWILVIFCAKCFFFQFSLLSIINNQLFSFSILVANISIEERMRRMERTVETLATDFKNFKRDFKDDLENANKCKLNWKLNSFFCHHFTNTNKFSKPIDKQSKQQTLFRHWERNHLNLKENSLSKDNIEESVIVIHFKLVLEFFFFRSINFEPFQITKQSHFNRSNKNKNRNQINNMLSISKSTSSDTLRSKIPVESLVESVGTIQSLCIVEKDVWSASGTNICVWDSIVKSNYSNI